MGVSEGWVVCSHNGETVIAKEFCDGVIFCIHNKIGDSWGEAIYVMGWEIKTMEGDMDDNALVRMGDD